MTYNTGTATDHLDLLTQLVQVVTGRHLATVAVNAGGTGHAVGDVLGIDGTGATSTHVASVEVTSETGGVIDGVRVYRGGAYTVDPTTTTGNAQSSSTGSGTGATFDLTFAATGWSLLAATAEASTATVANGGSSYNVNDTLTLVGGVVSEGGTAATYNVDTAPGGVVGTVSLVNPGNYEILPTSPVLTTVSPAGGTGCTLNVTSAIPSGEKVIVLQGDAGAATDPLVGIKTYSSETDETGGSTVYNWALFGMTSWSSALALHDQANVSPGFSTVGDGSLTTSTTGDGAFFPLKDADAFDIEWSISATGRRVHVIARVEGAATVHYPQASFGLLNPYGISTELPFPAYVAGSSDRKRVWYRDTASLFGGLSEVIERNLGPFFVWGAEGDWVNAKVATLSSNQSLSPNYSVENDAPRAHVWPLGVGAIHSDSDDVIWSAAGGAGFDNDDLTLASGAVEIYRTPDTGGDLFPLLPVTLTQADSSGPHYRTFGELDGVFFVHPADSGMSSEDRLTQGGLAFSVYQNGTRVQPWSYLALQED